MERRTSTIAALTLAIAIAIALLASLPSEAQTTGTIAGSIHGADGKPIAGATVRVIGTTQGALSKADGSVLIAGVRAGDYQLLISAVGYTRDSIRIHVSLAQTTTFKATLRPRAATEQEPTTIVHAIRPKSVGKPGIPGPGDGMYARTSIAGAVALSRNVITGGIPYTRPRTVAPRRLRYHIVSDRTPWGGMSIYDTFAGFSTFYPIYAAQPALISRFDAMHRAIAEAGSWFAESEGELLQARSMPRELAVQHITALDAVNHHARPWAAWMDTENYFDTTWRPRPVHAAPRLDDRWRPKIEAQYIDPAPFSIRGSR